MRDEQKQALAERIASALHNDSSADGNEQVWKAIEDLGNRLEAIEKSLSSSGTSVGSSRVVTRHPSLDKYAVLEASESNGDKEKHCTFEPHGRVCDHCSMCNSRGF